jgi:hypothetical protein
MILLYDKGRKEFLLISSSNITLHVFDDKRRFRAYC